MTGMPVLVKLLTYPSQLSPSLLSTHFSRFANRENIVADCVWKSVMEKEGMSCGCNFCNLANRGCCLALRQQRKPKQNNEEGAVLYNACC
jgi:hypothetical protein